MQTQAHLPESSLEQVIKKIFTSYRITRADQQLFMKTLLSKDTLTPQEQEQIDRVFDALRRGLLRVVD